MRAGSGVAAHRRTELLAFPFLADRYKVQQGRDGAADLPSYTTYTL